MVRHPDEARAEPNAVATTGTRSAPSLELRSRHDRGAALRSVLGSISHAVLRHAPCPVAVVHRTTDLPAVCRPVTRPQR
ncbi:universal stress protein [Lentzea atacamensis]|uniref:universal stress protein n=1 Tax=Lentzea atacamensis TaxID=531938 RepID=UPI002D771C3A|nr:universal stress protein [Lentzea atacamensis]